MSRLSVALHGFASAVEGGFSTLFEATAANAQTKQTITDSLAKAKAILVDAASTATSEVAEAAPGAVAEVIANPTVKQVETTAAGVATAVGADLAPGVESALGAAAEAAVDAEIASVTGPFSPLAISLANQLLNVLGGSAESAIAHLLQAKGITTPVTIVSTPPSPIPF